MNVKPLKALIDRLTFTSILYQVGQVEDFCDFLVILNRTLFRFTSKAKFLNIINRYFTTSTRLYGFGRV